MTTLRLLSPLRGCGGLERNDFGTIFTMEGYGGLERTDAGKCSFQESLVVLVAMW